MGTFMHASGATATITDPLTPAQIARVLSTTKAQLAQTRDRLRAACLLQSKAAIRDSVTADTHIIHLITQIDELSSTTNRLAKRLRDWYACYDPELEHATPDHTQFVEAVLQAPTPARDSMGAKLTEAQHAAILAQAQIIHQLIVQRGLLVEQLDARCKETAPNLHAIAGAMVGAKLLSHAGSLRRLAMLPAGTVQLLGAETALFRHLRNRHARPPKHGVIFNHILIQRAPKELRGKVARVLADCISIGARIDFFKGDFLGDQLLKKVEAVR